MKTQELRQIIREEISNVLNENENVFNENAYQSKLYGLEAKYKKNGKLDADTLIGLIKSYSSQIQVLRGILNTEFPDKKIPALPSNL